MSKFNDVFLVIKKYAARQPRLAELYCFDVIARESKIPEARLEIYLDYLQDVGLIRYSKTEKYIYLTSHGRMQNEVPTIISAPNPDLLMPRP